MRAELRVQPLELVPSNLRGREDTHRGQGLEQTRVRR